MRIEIIGLETEHLEDAAKLVCERFRALRERMPVLPERYEETGPILENLVSIQEEPGVAAFREGKMIGFMTGIEIAEFMGKRSAYSPEWANATAIGEKCGVYEAMYASLASHWVANGCYTHLVSLMGNDLEGLDAWIWLGFGLVAVDALKDLSRVEGNGVDVQLRRADIEDLELVTAFLHKLDDHLAAPPIYWPHQTELEEAWLSNPEKAMWLAYEGGNALGCMGFESGYDEGCIILQDEKTISISSAFTNEDARGGGVATALLNKGLAWASERGYTRCALDFEAMNSQARRFWLRWFEPACYSLMRVLNERAGVTK